ncbi:MAG TPA: thioredoxin family protein [Chthoniobacteraceae bacterium]|nr:thioredoxin family protein [Chthoniobacteraceae bacterium]
MKTSPLGWIAVALLIGTVLHADEPLWTDNYQKAVERAQTEGKALLLDFNGSDWCGWCIKMRKETLDQPQFKDYAKNNLVLVDVDFPARKPQTQMVKEQNQKLKQQYQVQGYPDLILVSKGGRVLDRVDGYMAGGPSAFIAEIQKHYHGASGGTGPAASPADDFDTFFKKPAGS